MDTHRSRRTFRRGGGRQRDRRHEPRPSRPGRVPWTVNDRATLESLIDIGVDGLITDRPDLLRQILGERGFRLPRAYGPPS